MVNHVWFLRSLFEVVSRCVGVSSELVIVVGVCQKNIDLIWICLSRMWREGVSGEILSNARVSVSSKPVQVEV